MSLKYEIVRKIYEQYIEYGYNRLWITKKKQ